MRKDTEVVAQWIGISYDDWQKRAREILHYPDTPFSYKNGIWKIVNRSEFWNLLGSRILDKDLDSFRVLAINVLGESDPAFELSVEERYVAGIRGKVMEYSHELRKGIAEGLAILANNPDAASNSSLGKAEDTSTLVVRELLTEADWKIWGSLNSLLPILAEAAPDAFLKAVDGALSQTPCPFDELFAQESNGVVGRNYLTGLLWALEALAWDEQYLIRTCIILGELASHDPGGQWANRPIDSLITILLPWWPQTLASVEKRKVAVETLLKERPGIGWNLIIQLLPGQQKISSGSYKPKWRQAITDDHEEVTHQEFWELASFYAELTVSSAGTNVARLSELIDHFDHLSLPAFDKLIEILSSKDITEQAENQRYLIWDRLIKFTARHRRFAGAKWALADELITRIEVVAKQLAPTDPFNSHQYLFTDSDADLYEEKGNWKEQRKKIEQLRESAIREIFQQSGMQGVIQFAKSVASPRQVGYSLASIDDETVEETLLPSFLDSTDKKLKVLARRYIWRRHQVNGWEWCDNISKSGWTNPQIGFFLACLPFSREAWDRASQWLGKYNGEYWSRTDAYPHQTDDDLTTAVKKLLEYSRPYAAIDCLNKVCHDKQSVDVNLCFKALLSAFSSNEPIHTMDQHNVVELIKFLQTETSVSKEDLFKVEWAYLPFLLRDRGVAPKTLENKLAGDPEFFCEVIQSLYRSKKEEKPPKEPSEETKAIATNAWRLLHEWRTIPGSQVGGSFNADCFNDWLEQVKTNSSKSGHLESALTHIGEVLFHAPPDPDGLWIHRAIAEALNDKSAECMRDGFTTGIFNSRGVHGVDPTGQPEKDLAERFYCKAEEVENAGFQRLATVLRILAKGYERESKLIVSEHQQEDA